MDERTSSAPAFDAIGIARHLLRTVRAGALATLEAVSGAPFVSLVTVATDVDGSPILLLSALSAHTTNLDADPRASLLLSGGGKGDPLAHARLSVSGRVEPYDDPRIRRRFLARHPKAELYADFPDFGFRRLHVESAHLNGGFARAARIAGADLVARVDDAEGLVAGEEAVLSHMNEDHADALELYATRLAGAPAGAWRATGIDPDGIDLGAGDLTARVAFPRRITTRPEMRAVLVELVQQAEGGSS